MPRGFKHTTQRLENWMPVNRQGPALASLDLGADPEGVASEEAGAICGLLYGVSHLTGYLQNCRSGPELRRWRSARTQGTRKPRHSCDTCISFYKLTHIRAYARTHTHTHTHTYGHKHFPSFFVLHTHRDTLFVCKNAFPQTHRCTTAYTSNSWIYSHEAYLYCRHTI